MCIMYGLSVCFLATGHTPIIIIIIIIIIVIIIIIIITLFTQIKTDQLIKRSTCINL